MKPVKSNRGRRAALWVLFAAILIAVAAFWLGRRTVVERYELWRLESGDDIAREAAARRLTALGCEEAIPLLGELVEREDDLALVAAESLAKLDEAGLRELSMKFWTCSPDFRRRVVESLVEGDPLEETLLPFLVLVTLEDPVERHRTVAAHKGLTRFGAKAVPGLLAGLHEGNETQKRALIFLGVLKEDARDAVAPIMEVVRGGGQNATQAGSTLAYVGTPALPTLIKALGDPDERVRWQAARSLGRMRSAAAPAVPALIGALGDARYRVREKAVDTLRTIGTAANAALPALLDALEKTSFGMRDAPSWTSRGDSRWNARAALPGAIVAAFGGADDQSRECAIDALLDATFDGNPCVAAAAVRALGVLRLDANRRVEERLRALSAGASESDSHVKRRPMDCDEQLPQAARFALQQLLGTEDE